MFFNRFYFLLGHNAGQVFSILNGSLIVTLNRVPDVLVQPGRRVGMNIAGGYDLFGLSAALGADCGFWTVNIKIYPFMDVLALRTLVFVYWHRHPPFLLR